MIEILNTYRKHNNSRMKLYYYMIKDVDKKLIKNNNEINKKIIYLTYSLIISYLIIIYLLFIK